MNNLLIYINYTFYNMSKKMADVILLIKNIISKKFIIYQNLY